MNAELWAEIKRLFAVEKLTITTIAERLRLDRKTVRRVVRSERLPKTSRQLTKPSVLEPYKPYLTERLERYPRLRATVLLREIKKQGYAGQLRILQEYLTTIRSEKTKEVFLRIETTPGEEAQCDWANCGTVRIGRVVRKLSAFVMVLSYSRMIYVEFTLSQCLEDFLQCHINAFRFFGGVPKKIRYDNLKQVVLCRFGAELKFNPHFMEFSGVFGFEPSPCNVARGNEKGKAENGIFFLRVNFLDGLEIRWPDINLDVQSWLREVANVRIHRTTRERPMDRWEKEKPFLLALPERPYDTAIVRPVRASHQALVAFQGNFYSVPHAYARHTLVLKATPTQVRLLESLGEMKEIAAHPRSYDTAQVIEDPKHYEGILATKRTHFTNILHKRFMELGTTAKKFLEGLVITGVQPLRHLQKILNLVSTYGREDVISAMEHAMVCNAYGASYVENILLQRREAQGLPELPSLNIPQRPEWNDLITDEPDLDVYDQALGAPPGPEPRPPDQLTLPFKEPPPDEEAGGPTPVTV